MPIWPPQNTGLFELKKPCCSCAGCLMHVSQTNGQCLAGNPAPDLPNLFANLTDATAAMTNQVSNCMGYIPAGSRLTPTITATVGHIAGTLVSSSPAFGGSVETMCGLHLLAGSVLSGSWAGGGDYTSLPEGIITLKDSAGAVVASVDSHTASGTFSFTIPTDGCYFLDCVFSGTDSGGAMTTISITVAYSCTLAFTMANIVIDYDNGSGAATYLVCT